MAAVLMMLGMVFFLQDRNPDHLILVIVLTIMNLILSLMLLAHAAFLRGITIILVICGLYMGHCAKLKHEALLQQLHATP